MKGFRFRLEPILALRRSQEEELQCELADRERALAGAKACLAAIAGEISLQERQIESRGQPGALDVDGMLMASSYLASLRRRADAHAAVVEDRGHLVSECRSALLSATTYRKGLEKLREQQLELFEQGVARKDQLNTEEMATQRHHRRAPNESEVI